MPMIYNYAHPEYFSGWEIPDFKQYSGNLILYGAGRRGMVAAHCLKKLGIEFICFCDSDVLKHGTIVSGHEVISPEDMKEKYQEAVILITNTHYLYLKDLLDSWGFKTFSCVSLFFNIDFEGFDHGFSFEYMCRNTDHYYNVLQSIKREYLPWLQFFVTNRCTLRCRECSAYIPYAADQADFDSDIMIECMNKLLTVYNEIGNVDIYGGEPFLYKDLLMLLRDFIPKQQVKKITIITNGTLIPNPELLEAFSNPKIRIRISNYGILSTRRDELIEILNKNNVYTEITDHYHWNLIPTIDILNETEEQLKEKVRNCCAVSKIPFILDGKLFYCKNSAFFDYYKAVPDFGDNYIDLVNYAGSAEDLYNELNKKLQMAENGLPKETCKFCKVDYLAQHLPVAEQTTETFTFKKIVC